MKRPVHFEIYATDPLRAAKFYTDVFSWEIKKWEWGEFDYWLIMTGPKEEMGINGWLLRRDTEIESGSPSGFVCTMDVASVDEYAQKVEKSGGTIVVAKTEVPGAGWLVYCKDTEWNLFGIIESTPM